MYPRPRMTTRGFARAPFRFECPMQRGLPDCGSDADGRDYETFSSAISVDNLPPSLAPNEAPEFWGSGRAGLPATMASGGTSRVTTAPAPTIARSPITMPGRMVVLAPMEAPRFTNVCTNVGGYCLLRGNASLVKVALGPMKTSSSMVIPSHNWTPHLTVTR